VEESAKIISSSFTRLTALAAICSLPIRFFTRRSRCREFTDSSRVKLAEGGGPAATAICAAARLGAKTSFISAVGDDSRGQSILKGLALEGVDTTGAGDVFHGAFAYRYATGGDWQACLRFATAVAALKCTKLGGRTGIPTLAETELFLQEHE
jgi:sugar/nucleoside kinase (ribokinase family)